MITNKMQRVLYNIGYRIGEELDDRTDKDNTILAIQEIYNSGDFSLASEIIGTYMNIINSGKLGNPELMNELRELINHNALKAAEK